MNAQQSCPDLGTSSPSSSVGVCSDPCREAAKIGSVPTDGGGCTEMLPTPLQSLNRREGVGSEHPGQVTRRFAPTAKLSRLSRMRLQRAHENGVRFPLAPLSRKKTLARTSSLSYLALKKSSVKNHDQTCQGEGFEPRVRRPVLWARPGRHAIVASSLTGGCRERISGIDIDVATDTWNVPHVRFEKPIE